MGDRNLSAVYHRQGVTVAKILLSMDKHDYSIPLEHLSLSNRLKSVGLQVQALNMRKECVSGSIPECIGNHSNLTSLILSDNRLSGTVPNCIGTLTNLTILKLNDNQLSGSIPETMGNLAKLESLYVEE